MTMTDSRPQSVVPDASLLAEVFPTERFNAKGVPTGQLRTELRSIADLRNAISVAGVWVQTFGMLVVVDQVVERTGALWLWGVAFVLMGRGHGLFGILGHEAAHRLLFTKQSVNDGVGRYLVNCPTFVSQDAYRRSHMAHHRDALGPNEPDKTLYAGYPITKASLRRKLRRDLVGESGLKLLRGLLRALKAPISRNAILQIFAVQAVLAIALGIAVGWWAWPVLWLGSWMTVWRVINRLRAIAEHAGMVSSPDERKTTHHVEQNAMARFWMVPFNTGWHVAHHLDAGVTFRNLPRFHNELVAAGYFPDGLIYPNYRALWKRLASRPSEGK